MNGLVKCVRHIQVKKIAYCPTLFKAVITYEPYSTEFDESDDLEYQKDLMNNLINDRWFHRCDNPDFVGYNTFGVPCDQMKLRRGINRQWGRETIYME